MSLTFRSPAQIGGALLVVLVLFGAALAIGSATAPTGSTSAAAPVRVDGSSSTTTISAPPAAFKLPPLRHPAPKPVAKPVSSPPAVSAPVTSAPAGPAPATPAPAAPAAPAASSGGSGGSSSGGGGGGGGGVIISK